MITVVRKRAMKDCASAEKVNDVKLCERREVRRKESYDDDDGRVAA